MRFSRKLFLIAGTSAVAFLFVIVLGVVASQLVNQQIESIEARYLPMVELAPKLEAELEHLRGSLRDAVSAQDHDALEATRAAKDALLAHVDRGRDVMHAGDAAVLRASIERYYGAAYAVSARLIQDETGEAIIEAMSQMQRAHAQVVADLKRTTSIDRSELTAAFETVRQANSVADGFRVAIAVVSLAFVLGLTLWISRSVLRSLGSLSEGFARFGEGHFDVPMPILSKDELGDAARNANYMAEKLRASQEQLRRTNLELQQQTAELDSFSYSVSHDLRAPLRAIDGFTKILIEDHAAALDEDGKRVAEIIRFNTQKMGRLIDDLLEFSRLGRHSVQRRSVDMHTMARDAFEEAAQAEPTRSISLDLPKLPPAFGDGALLKQVWVNLFSNGVKYTRGRPEASIAVSFTKSDREVTYTVRDNGVGFDMKYVDKLFGVFQRLHTHAEFEGTGVGLALVSRIVQRHGGRIWAEAQEGVGAAFSFALPVEERDP